MGIFLLFCILKIYQSGHDFGVWLYDKTH
jgi:hypothetical protein